MKKNNNGIEIEKIHSVERLKQCAEILMEAYNREPWNDQWTIDTARTALAYYFHIPEFKGWIATSSSIIVGCCIGNVEPYYTGKNFILKELFVSPKSQKRGVGKKLLAALKTYMEVNGVKTAMLFTRKEILDFYIKSGFSEVSGMEMMIYAKNDK